ncbi:fibrobacter succinogenes major paralogous domain-containing protein [Echinicola vietnamensis]|uniref:Fibrobacter succinogenes major paralogous domain-containing protein n=1 Tax=Echinicola vietnamensis (strain DSM 17526 / LMG 23754 / KMM 6221) TaxID=926556 RepID=L0G4F7_ECHVK|nr:fibrobacter succinogenes major paralogous domain-containing protein [Echinicola vietnamensis]AGA79710.1 hypothetical protein (Fib_succ_major) [Echinicola vietnamensis DSM 17526]
MNKATYSYLLLIYLFLSGCVQESIEEPKMGTVSFSKVTFEHFGNMSPNGRTAAESEWKHIFAESATLLITNKATGQEYTLEYDPNDFSYPYQIELPYGDYTIFSEVEGGDFEYFLPFVIEGEFSLDANRIDHTLHGTTEYGLVSVEKEFASSANLNQVNELIPGSNGKVLYIYAKSGLSPLLTIYEVFNGQALKAQLDIAEHSHYHYQLKLTEIQGVVSFVELIIGPFEYYERYIEIADGGDIPNVTDAEGNVYEVVKIGGQYWMAENLRNSIYCNGDTLETFPYPKILSENPDEGYTTFPMAVIKQRPETGKDIYYYNYEAVTSDENICPCDWHVSTDADWMTLERHLGISERSLLSTSRGADVLAGERLKDANLNEHFPELELREISSRTGFNASPSSYMEVDSPTDDIRTFYLDDFFAYWWANSPEKPLFRAVDFKGLNYYGYGYGKYKIIRSMHRHTISYFPVRCVKNQ